MAISLSYNNPPPPLSSQVGSIEWHLGEAVAAATDGPVQTLWARKAGKMVTGGGSSLKIWVERVPGVGDDAAAAAQPWLEAWDVQVRAPDPLDPNPTQGVREYERSFPGFQASQRRYCSGFSSFGASELTPPKYFRGVSRRGRVGNANTYPPPPPRGRG